MALSITTLASTWRRFWARDTLPPAPPAARHGTTPERRLLARLLAREALPDPTGDPPSRAPSFTGRLLAREHLPHPSAPAPRRDRDPE